MKKIILFLFVIFSVALALPTPSDIAKEVQAGHYHKAEMLLKEVLQKDPNSAKAHYMLSQVYYLEGKDQKALQELKVAKKLDPSESFAHRGYLKNYERELQKSVKVRKSTFGGAMIFFLIGALLIAGAVFLYISNKLTTKNKEDIKTKLMQELTLYLENIEKVKTKLSIDLVSLKDDDPAKKDLSNRLNELDEIRKNMIDLLQKLKNNDVKDIQGAYVYFENLKDKLKEVATGVKNTYETHEDLKNFQDTVPSQSYPQQPNMSMMGGGMSFMDLLGMMAMGSLMGSIFSGGFGGGFGMGPTIVENNYYNEPPADNIVDNTQDMINQDTDNTIDFTGGDDWGNDVDTNQDDSWS
ncbi:tetratricopeptide repeat protein [Hydrogenobaculum acidophilum]